MPGNLPAWPHEGGKREKDKVDEMWADLYLTIYLKVNKYCKLDLHLRVGVVWKASKQLDSKDIMYVYAGSVSFSYYIGR